MTIPLVANCLIMAHMDEVSLWVVTYPTQKARGVSASLPPAAKEHLHLLFKLLRCLRFHEVHLSKAACWVLAWVVGLVGRSVGFSLGLFGWLVVGLVVFVGSIHVRIFDL